VDQPRDFGGGLGDVQDQRLASARDIVGVGMRGYCSCPGPRCGDVAYGGAHVRRTGP
jgi:hypothetical protein